jgi:cell division protein FtsL
MVRVLNFFCVALMGLSILALYHVSESTRVAHVRLDRMNQHIAQTRQQISVFETEWARVADPDRIQQLAEQQLGMSDTTSVRLSSFNQLPVRGANAPLGGTPLRNASIVTPAGHPLAVHPLVSRALADRAALMEKISDRSGM